MPEKINSERDFIRWMGESDVNLNSDLALEYAKLKGQMIEAMSEGDESNKQQIETNLKNIYSRVQKSTKFPEAIHSPTSPISTGSTHTEPGFPPSPSKTSTVPAWPPSPTSTIPGPIPRNIKVYEEEKYNKLLKELKDFYSNKTLPQEIKEKFDSKRKQLKEEIKEAAELLSNAEGKITQEKIKPVQRTIRTKRKALETLDREEKIVFAKLFIENLNEAFNKLNINTTINSTERLTFVKYIIGTSEKE